MPNPRPIILALALTGASAGLFGCGGSSGPAASIPADNSQILLAKIQEIEANVQVGSCLVAESKTDDLIADVQDLPASVNSDVKQALDSGANNLKLLLSDQCQGRTSTTTPSTTESTTTESTTTTKTRPTTTTNTQTQPSTTTQTQTTPTNPSGGVGPGSPGGL